MPNILIAIDSKRIPPAQIERIRALVGASRLIITDRQEEIEPLLGEIEVAAGHFPVEWIARAPRLRWYQQWGAGTDWLMRHPEAAAKDFILTNASGVHAIPISEHILAFMLAFARGLPAAFGAQREHHWEHDRDPGAFELAGKTVLMVGVGAIGKRTAHICTAMGMRVLGVRRDPSRAVVGIEQMLGIEELDRVLPQADFVVLTIPLTQDTRCLFDQKRFAKMKPSAYLINIGRGGTVNEDDLVAALHTGQFAGAGLDVFATEPLPAESPLWDMPNVIITAHYSGNTPFYDERAFAIFTDNLERFLKGQPMRNVVDKKRGY